MHFRDIPGKVIPLNDKMQMRVQVAGGIVLGYVMITFENRHVINAEIIS